MTSKVTGKRFESYRDSLKSAPTLYLLPVLGDKVQKQGYELPLPVGLMLGHFIQTQNIDITNLEVGFGDSELVDVSEIVAFESINTRNRVTTFRPDFYILPFWNVYGIFNRFENTSDVVLKKPFELVIPQVNSTGYGGGFGTTLAYGHSSWFVAANFNLTWSETSVLTVPVRATVTSVRTGYILQNRKRNRKITVWGGINYQDFHGTSEGSYDLTQLLSDDREFLNEVQGKLEDLSNGLNNLYEDFCSDIRNRPQCLVIDGIVGELTDRVQERLDGIERPEEVRINYAFNNAPEKNVNVMVGTQIHFTRRWQLRFEVGFINRRTYMANLNYRLGLFKRKNEG